MYFLGVKHRFSGLAIGIWRDDVLQDFKQQNDKFYINFFPLSEPGMEAHFNITVQGRRSRKIRLN